MDADQLKEKMKAHSLEFNVLWNKIIIDVNDYLKDNPDKGLDALMYSPVEALVDNLCLSGAWIKDRLSGIAGFVGSNTYKKSLAKKIRKALGYTV